MLRQTIVVTHKRHANVTFQAVELFHHLILLFIMKLYTTKCLHRYHEHAYIDIVDVFIR